MPCLVVIGYLMTESVMIFGCHDCSYFAKNLKVRNNLTRQELQIKSWLCTMSAGINRLDCTTYVDDCHEKV